MWKKEEHEITQCIDTCVTIRLYNTKGILNIPKNILFISRMFFGCFLDVFWMLFVCLEHSITSKIQIYVGYVGYVFEKKEATFCSSSNRKKPNL